MKTYGGVDVTSTLVGGEWSASRPGLFTPGETAPVTSWTGGWVDPRASLDDVEKRKFLTLPGLEHSNKKQIFINSFFNFLFFIISFRVLPFFRHVPNPAERL
jgi:hypothetical protein